MTLRVLAQEFVDTISDDRVFVEFGTNASLTLRHLKQFKTRKAFVLKLAL